MIPKIRQMQSLGEYSDVKFGGIGKVPNKSTAGSSPPFLNISPSESSHFNSFCFCSPSCFESLKVGCILRIRNEFLIASSLKKF